MALSTVSAVLSRIGLGKRSRPVPPEPPNRYERKRPGELDACRRQEARADHIRGAGHRVTGNRASQSASAKRLGATGWEFVHVASTTPPAWPTSRCWPTRRSDAERLPAARGRLVREMGHHGRAGALRQRLLLPLKVHARAAQNSGSATSSPAPTGPRTNGKAERFIQTLTNSWAYGAIYGTSAERTAALPGWLDPLQLQETTRLPRPQATRNPSTPAEEPPRNYT